MSYTHRMPQLWAQICPPPTCPSKMTFLVSAEQFCLTPFPTIRNSHKLLWSHEQQLIAFTIELQLIYHRNELHVNLIHYT